MPDIVVIIGSGLIATACMILSMTFISVAGLANGDMVRALGSIFTKKYENALLPGLLIHLFGGTIFALIYTGVWSIFDFQYPESFLLAGAIAGFAHGFVMSFVMAVAVAEFHPLPKFRRVGFGVAVTHILGHVVYGVVLGGLIGYSLT